MCNIEWKSDHESSNCRDEDYAAKARMTAEGMEKVLEKELFESLV